MTGVAKNTIAKLLVELGAACSDYMDENLRNLKCKKSSATKFGRSWQRKNERFREASRVQS